MEVYFTSPTLGQILGTVTTTDQEIYQFKGQNVLISIELLRSKTGWICRKDEWLLPSQIEELGSQIDKTEEWLSAK